MGPCFNRYSYVERVQIKGISNKEEKVYVFTRRK